jgi:hypothetical protein
MNIVSIMPVQQEDKSTTIFYGGQMPHVQHQYNIWPNKVDVLLKIIQYMWSNHNRHPPQGG